MTDKPTGPAAAARELWEPLKKVFQAANLTPNPNMETNIEAIIKKHCLEDKAVGKLVEDIATVVGEMSGIEDPKGLSHPAMRALIIGWKHNLITALVDLKK